MKKYTQPGVKILASLSVICMLLCAAGVLLLLCDSDQTDWILLCLGMGIPFGILFLPLAIVCAKCYILLDDEKIVFPITRVPRLRFKRNAVSFGEIDHVHTGLYKGDGVRSKDTMFYRFVLKNGLEFTLTLFSYGKEGEREIAAHLKKHVRFV